MTVVYWYSYSFILSWLCPVFFKSKSYFSLATRSLLRLSTSCNNILFFFYKDSILILRRAVFYPYSSFFLSLLFKLSYFNSNSSYIFFTLIYWSLRKINKSLSESLFFKWPALDRSLLSLWISSFRSWSSSVLIFNNRWYSSERAWIDLSFD